MLLQSALLCLAMNVYYEARGEPVQGQMAVAYVTLNRSESSGRSVCREVVRASQFSWTKSMTVRKTAYGEYLLQPRDRPTFEIRESRSWMRALYVAAIASGTPRSQRPGWTNFHAKSVSPKWAPALGVPTKIGNHLFYTESKHVRGERYAMAMERVQLALHIQAGDILGRDAGGAGSLVERDRYAYQRDPGVWLADRRRRGYPRGAVEPGSAWA